MFDEPEQVAFDRSEWVAFDVDPVGFVALDKAGQFGVQERADTSGVFGERLDEGAVEHGVEGSGCAFEGDV